MNSLIPQIWKATPYPVASRLSHLHVRFTSRKRMISFSSLQPLQTISNDRQAIHVIVSLLLSIKIVCTAREMVWNFETIESHARQLLFTKPQLYHKEISRFTNINCSEYLHNFPPWFKIKQFTLFYFQIPWPGNRFLIDRQQCAYGSFAMS